MPKFEQYQPWHMILQPNPKTNAGGLWLGDYSSALNRKSLDATNIRTVVTAAAGLKLHYPADINHKILQLYDCQTERIERYFQEAHQHITEGLKTANVLVHCFAGVSRSSTIVIAYLMREFGWSFKDSLSFTKKRRRYVEPNKGFVKALRRFQRELMAGKKDEEEPAASITKSPSSPANQQYIKLALKRHSDQKTLKENIEPNHRQPTAKVGLNPAKSQSRSIAMRGLQSIYMGRSSSKKRHGRHQLPSLCHSRQQ